MFPEIHIQTWNNYICFIKNSRRYNYQIFVIVILLVLVYVSKRVYFYMLECMLVYSPRFPPTISKLEIICAPPRPPHECKFCCCAELQKFWRETELIVRQQWTAIYPRRCLWSSPVKKWFSFSGEFFSQWVSFIRAAIHFLYKNSWLIEAKYGEIIAAFIGLGRDFRSPGKCFLCQ